MIPPQGFALTGAGAADAALLRDVMLRCWTGTVAANSSAYRESVDDIARQIAGGFAVILWSGKEAVGSARMFPVPGPAGDQRTWVEIKRVGVLKALRGQGLAAPMVAKVEDEARAQGHAGAQLGVRKDQPRLVSFWRSLGYATADDVKLHTVNPLTPPPVTMRKWFL